MPLSELALEQFSGDKEHGGKGGFSDLTMDRMAGQGIKRVGVFFVVGLIWASCARANFFFPFLFSRRCLDIPPDCCGFV
jgi:hypothetical protein